MMGAISVEIGATAVPKFPVKGKSFTLNFYKADWERKGGKIGKKELWNAQQ